MPPVTYSEDVAHKIAAPVRKTMVLSKNSIPLPVETVVKLDTQLAPPSTDAEKKVRQIFDKLEKAVAKSKERQGL